MHHVVIGILREKSFGTIDTRTDPVTFTRASSSGGVAATRARLLLTESQLGDNLHLGYFLIDTSAACHLFLAIAAPFLLHYAAQ